MKIRIVFSLMALMFVTSLFWMAYHQRQMNLVNIESFIGPSGRMVVFLLRDDGAPANVTALASHPSLTVNGGAPIALANPIWGSGDKKIPYVVYPLDESDTIAPGATVTASVAAGWATTAAGAAPALAGAVVDVSNIGAAFLSQDVPASPSMAVGTNLLPIGPGYPGRVFANLMHQAEVTEGLIGVSGGTEADLEFNEDGDIVSFGGATEARVLVISDLPGPPVPTGPSGVFTLRWDGRPDALQLVDRFFPGSPGSGAAITELTYPEQPAPEPNLGTNTAARFLTDLGAERSGLKLDPANMPNLAGSSFTFAFWWKLDGPNFGGNRVLQIGTGTGAFRYRANGEARFTYYNGTDWVEVIASAPTDTPSRDDGYEFVIVWVDNTAGTLNIDTGGTVSSIALNGLFQSGLESEPLRLGHAADSGWIDHATSGMMAGLGMWKRTLTAPERAFLRAGTGVGGSPRPYAELGVSATDGAGLLTNLESYWPLTEASGTRADAHTTGRNLAEQSGAGWTPVTQAAGPWDAPTPPVEPGVDHEATYDCQPGVDTLSPQIAVRYLHPATNVRLYAPETDPDNPGLFHPDAIQRLEGMNAIRFMENQQINGCGIVHPADLPRRGRLGSIVGPPPLRTASLVSVAPFDGTTVGFTDVTWVPNIAWAEFTTDGPHGLTMGQPLQFRQEVVIDLDNATTYTFYTAGFFLVYPSASDRFVAWFDPPTSGRTVTAGLVSGTVGVNSPGGSLPVTDMLAMCAASNGGAGSDLWISIPHLATDATVEAYVDEIAAWLATHPTRVLYLEFTNEVWNSGGVFNQGQVLIQIAKHTGLANGSGWQYYAYRANQIFILARARLVAAGVDPGRVKRVLAGQEGWVGPANSILAQAVELAMEFDIFALAPYLYLGPMELGAANEALLGSLSDEQCMDLGELWVEHARDRAWTGADPVYTDGGMVTHRNLLNSQGFPGVKLGCYEGGPEFYGLFSERDLQSPPNMPAAVERGHRLKNHPRARGLMLRFLANMQTNTCDLYCDFLLAGGLWHLNHGPIQFRWASNWGKFNAYGQLSGLGDGSDGLVDNRITPLEDHVAVHQGALRDWGLALASVSDPLISGTLSEPTDITQDSARLSWTAASGGIPAISEQLQRAPSGSGTWADVTGATTSPHTDPGLSAATAYDYRVRYADSGNPTQVAFSDVRTVTTVDPPQPDRPKKLPPGKGKGKEIWSSSTPQTRPSVGYRPPRPRNRGLAGR